MSLRHRPSPANTAHAPAAAAPALYTSRIASTADDIRAAQVLRFEVFNIELDEGLVQSYDTGHDADPFDQHCAHLIVEDAAQGTVVGTYRMQTGTSAAAALGYYSEREFDFSPFEPHRPLILELGRACIHQSHRNFAVLNLLWKGIAGYARLQGARYLVGCSSLTSQDPDVGAAVYRRLAPHLAPSDWRTTPRGALACPLGDDGKSPSDIPRLLSAYLALGAAICGPPAIDREFRTIDFLTWLDIESPRVQAMQQRGRFVG